jgi:hypothetical protein
MGQSDPKRVVSALGVSEATGSKEVRTAVDSDTPSSTERVLAWVGSAG